MPDDHDPFASLAASAMTYPQARMRVTATYRDADTGTPESVDIEINDPAADYTILCSVIGWLVAPGGVRVAAHTPESLAASINVTRSEAQEVPR